MNRFIKKANEYFIQNRQYSNIVVVCKDCSKRMEFYGVDGTNAIKFICPICYRNEYIREDL